MTRNVFENNDPQPISKEESLKHGSKMHSLLPAVEEGHHYELMTLESGRVVVVVEKD